MKKKKNIKWILAAIGLIVVIVLVVVLAKSCKKKDKESPEEKQDEIINTVSIESGYYFSDSPTSCVRINEDGTAIYYPDFIANYNFVGDYSINNNVLTIQKNADYWKFKIIKEQLHLIQVRTGGVVVDCREQEKIFTRMEYNPGLMAGMTYQADEKMYLYYSEEEVRLYKYDQLVCLEREFSFEDNVLKFGKEEDKVTFIFKDNKFYLQDSWIDGKYYEFSKENIEFVSVLDIATDSKDGVEDCNIVEESKYNKAQGGLEPGYYYNSDLSTELIIKENGEAVFFPDTKSSKCTNGKYECVDGQMVLMEVFFQDYYDWSPEGWCIAVDDYFFDIRDDKLIYTKYLDKYGNITQYDESETTTLVYSEKPLINTIRQGYYIYRYVRDDAIYDDEYIYRVDLCFDNEGNASVSYYSYADICNECIFVGKYEVKDDIVMIALSNGKELTGKIADGCVVISDFTGIDEECLIGDEFECEYMGSLMAYFFN